MRVFMAIGKVKAVEERRKHRQVEAVGRLATMILVAGLLSCSDNTPLTSTGIEALSPEVLVMPSVKDRTPEEATARLMAAGFSGSVSLATNGKCSPGNQPGKIYRQEPAIGASVDSDRAVTLYSGCFEVAVSLSSGGYIVPVIDDSAERTGSENVFNIKAYNSLDFTVVPESGYGVASVSVNASKISLKASQRYRLPEITSDQIVSVVFSEDPEPAPNPEPAPDPAPATTYTITATLLAGDCTVSPSGAVTVNEGAGQNFDIVANSGVVALLEVDGIPETCDQLGCSYTFSSVTADHTLNVLCN